MAPNVLSSYVFVSTIVTVVLGNKLNRVIVTSIKFQEVFQVYVWTGITQSV